MESFDCKDIEVYLPRNLSDDTEYQSNLKARQLYQDIASRHRQQQQQVIQNTMGDSPNDDDANGMIDNFYLPTNEPKPDPLLGDSPLDNPVNAYNVGVTNLSSYLNDLTMSSNNSDNDTVFSEDYTAMTDVGEEGLDVADPGNISGTSSVSSEISSVFSEANDSGNPVEDGEIPGTSSNGLPKESDIVKPKTLSSKRDKPNIKLELTPPEPDIGEVEESPDNSPDKGETTPSEKSTEKYFDDDDEFDFLQKQPVKRSTSLKTNKTPPGTPHRKKAVRFADALGLDLESVKTIMKSDEPPEVPKVALKDLQLGMEEERKTEGIRYFSTSFAQPGASSTFFQRVQGQKVLLENCVADDKQNIIHGTIRVLNIAYHKKVTVRFTTNNWLTHTDIPASYVQNSNDGPTDRFAFTISVPSYFNVGSRLQFCVRYSANNEDFWDSNYGGNYVIECFAKASPLQSNEAWLTFL